MEDDDTIEDLPVTETPPECGTAEAMTWLHVTYNGPDGVRFTEMTACCYRHVPRPADVLPADAEVIEIVMSDARTRTVIRDGRAEVTASGATFSYPAQLA